MTIIRRREFIAGLGAGLLAAPAIVRAEGEPIVIRAGALKLIHSIAPYFYDQFVPARMTIGSPSARTMAGAANSPAPRPAMNSRRRMMVINAAPLLPV